MKIRVEHNGETRIHDTDVQSSRFWDGIEAVLSTKIKYVRADDAVIYFDRLAATTSDGDLVIYSESELLV